MIKHLALSLLFILTLSCQKKGEHYTITILEKDFFNSAFLQHIEEEEKALLSWYLFAYGNECKTNATSNKCKILDLMAIENECSIEHIHFLKNWFKKDVLMSSKLQNCPCLPLNFAIQNTYKKIIMNRSSDTISIQYEIWGINEAEEKTWNIEQTDYYLVQDDELIKIQIPKPISN